MIWAFKKIVRQIVGDKAISDYKQWKTGKRGLNANFSWRPDDGSRLNSRSMATGCLDVNHYGGRH